MTTITLQPCLSDCFSAPALSAAADQALGRRPVTGTEWMSKVVPDRGRSRTTALLAGLLLGLAHAVPARMAEASPAFAGPSPRSLDVAGAMELGMSRAEVVEMLQEAAFAIEHESALPPAGRMRLLLAVPAGDDCLPQGAPLLCPYIRVSFLNDPRHGPRVVRIEAFEPVEGTETVADLLDRLGEGLGPPADSLAEREMVRGGSLIVWRRRWRSEAQDGPVLEILATQDPGAARPAWEGRPEGRALGAGYVLREPEDAPEPGRRRHFSRRGTR